MLDETLNETVQDDNANKQKLFVATVADNRDPVDINRVRVRIPGLLSGDASALPWFAPLRLAPFGMGSGFGIYGSPPIGASLIVYLQGGDVSSGFYVGGYHGVSQKDSDFSGPDVWGFKAPDGTKMIFNMAAQTMTFFHSSGYTYTVDSDGGYSMSAPGSYTVHSNGPVNVTGSIINLNP